MTGLSLTASTWPGLWTPFPRPHRLRSLSRGCGSDRPPEMFTTGAQRADRSQPLQRNASSGQLNRVLPCVLGSFPWEPQERGHRNHPDAGTVPPSLSHRPGPWGTAGGPFCPGSSVPRPQPLGVCPFCKCPLSLPAVLPSPPLRVPPTHPLQRKLLEFSEHNRTQTLHTLGRRRPALPSLPCGTRWGAPGARRPPVCPPPFRIVIAALQK